MAHGPLQGCSLRYFPSSRPSAQSHEVLAEAALIAALTRPCLVLLRASDLPPMCLIAWTPEPRRHEGPPGVEQLALVGHPPTRDAHLSIPWSGRHLFHFHLMQVAAYSL